MLIEASPKSSRRDLLTKATVGATLAWTVPLIATEAAFADGGTPKCRPNVTATCWVKDCLQGNKYLPGVQLVNPTGVTCPCVSSTSVVPCVKILGAGEVGQSTVILVYRDVASCDPASSANDSPLTTPTGWNPYPLVNKFFLGKARSGLGSIPALSNGSYYVDLCLGSPGCGGRGTQSAFVCGEYRLTLVWNSASNLVTSCSLVLTGSGTSTCGCSTTVAPTC